MNSFLYIFIGELFNIPLVIVLCYLPFYKKLTKPVGTIIVQLGAIFLFFAIPSYILMALGVYGVGDISATAFVITGYFYFKKTVKDGHQKRNFIFCIGIYAGGTAHGIIHILSMVDLWNRIEGLTALQARLILTVIFIFVYSIIGLILHYVITPRMRRVKSQDMAWLWVIPFMFSVLTYFYVVSYSIVGIVDIVFPIVFAMLTIISFIVFIMVIRMLERAEINAQLELEIADANKQRRSLVAEKATLENLAHMKTEYLANMSHETKAPLTLISVHVQRAAELFEEIKVNTNMFEMYETTRGDLASKSEKIGGSLVRAQEEVKRAALLAENALRFASLQEIREQMTPLDIVSLLTCIAEGYRPILDQHGNEIVLDIKSDLLCAIGNASQLVQVMINLLANANTHTKKGIITISANHKDDNIHIAVMDTGSGINHDLLPLVFERGITGGTGTGVGLAIAKDIIEDHGGAITIGADSNGTVVDFTLPAFYAMGG